MQKWARMLVKTGEASAEPFCNDDTNERGLRLLEFDTLKDLVLANTWSSQSIRKMDLA